MFGEIEKNTSVNKYFVIDWKLINKCNCKKMCIMSKIKIKRNSRNLISKFQDKVACYNLETQLYVIHDRIVSTLGAINNHRAGHPASYL